MTIYDSSFDHIWFFFFFFFFFFLLLKIYLNNSFLTKGNLNKVLQFFINNFITFGFFFFFFFFFLNHAN
jgi:hypothetical protein